MAASSTAFTRARRLTQAPDYSRVFAGAERSSDRWFTILARQNGLSRARLGLAISRRVASRAVDRNRLRRLARESFRHLPPAPLDFVVIAKKGAVEAENARLRASLDHHFSTLSRRALDASLDG